MFRGLRILVNQLGESASFAIEAIRGNKVRTFLSTLGITIGIFSIITVLALVDSIERSVRQSIDSLGKDAIIIDKWSWDFTGDYKWWKYAGRPNPSLSELNAIREKSVFADAACYVASLNVNVEYKSSSASGVTMQAVTHEYYRVKNFNLERGRFFSENEARNGTPVAVVGHELARNLFGTADPTGKEILVKKFRYKVIGIIEKQGESLFGNMFDNLVIVPLQCAAQHIRLNSNRNQATIEVKAREEAGPDMLEEELRGIMRAQRKLRPGQEANFALNKTSLFDEPVKQMTRVVTIAGWIIGGLAMLVGAFGIANIMFVSVKERTNQIGIKKSLGAKKVFILVEFLVEAIVLCLAGGIFGLMLVGGLTQLVHLVFGLQVALSPGNIITGLLTSLMAGILAGVVPAMAAARMDPVAAIRAK